MASAPPTHNKLLGRLNLTARKKSLQLGVLSLFALFVFGWLFTNIGMLLRSYDILRMIRYYGAAYDTRLLLLLLGLLAVLAAMVCLHEALHGLLIWAFTGKRPRFGFKIHPYAALPLDIYVSRNRGVVISLAPLVVVTVLGIPVILVFPFSFLWVPIFFLSFNAAASVGDVFVTGWLLRFKRDAMWGAEGTTNVVFG